MDEPRHLEIFLHGEPIGTLARIGSDRTIFGFSEDYVARSDRPTLGLSFKAESGELITELPAKTLRLLPFFSNLLPEGHLRRYLAERAQVDPRREFFLLAGLGEDLPGAVQAMAVASGSFAPEPDGIEEHEVPLRFSLAGVQLKFSALNEASGGLTIPATGAGGSWIVKLPSQLYPRVPENEFSMMTLARWVGIEIPEIELVSLNSIGNLPTFDLRGEKLALALKRFDRTDTGDRVHVEDFAQVFGVYPEAKYTDASYRSVASVLAAEAPEDVPQFIRRLTYCALIGNADMHLKNWSLIYPNRIVPRLAPAYDLICTVAYLADDEAALKVSRTRRFDRFDEEELRHLAAKAGLPQSATIDVARETVDRFRARWDEAKRELPITPEVARAVQQQVERVPLFRGTRSP